MLLHTNTPIINRFFTAGYMINHKMVKKFYNIFKTTEYFTLDEDLINILKDSELEEAKKIIRLNDRRKGIGIESNNSALYSSSDGLRINYNDKHSRQLLNPGIYYGI